MWFFAAVLILWGSTATMAQWETWIINPIWLWGLWTVNLYTCAAAAMIEKLSSFTTKLAALFGYTMIVVYYTTMGETYLELLPTSTTNPDLWPTVFLAVNLVSPMVMITAACMGNLVQRRGE